MHELNLTPTHNYMMIDAQENSPRRLCPFSLSSPSSPSSPSCPSYPSCLSCPSCLPAGPAVQGAGQYTCTQLFYIHVQHVWAETALML